MSGDIVVLDRAEQRFGGSLYHSEIARKAIESERFAFYERYLLMCRWHLISINLNIDEEDDRNIFWRYYLDPLFDCILPSKDVEVLCRAARIIVEKLLPSLPEYDEITFSENTPLLYGTELRLPEHQDTIWALDNCHSLLNHRHGQSIMLSFDLIFHEKLFHFFAEEVDLKFDCRVLEYWSKRFNRRIYQFVLDHLDPNIDKNSLPDRCLYREEPPNDGDFFNFVMFFWSMSEDYCIGPYMAEFLDDHPQLIPKIPSLMRELQNVKSSDSLLLEIPDPKPSAILDVFEDPEIIIPSLLDFLQNVQSQIQIPEHEVQFDIYCKPRGRSVLTM